jgi:CHASE2 domain-containing sensor protein
MKKAFSGTGRRAAVISFALVLFALLLQSPWTQVFESWTTDWRFRHFNRLTQASEAVVVINIDDSSVKSLEQFYGRWPFPRRVL